MRIYYIAECRSLNVCVATALGVDAERRNSFAERVLDWRRVMEDDFKVPTGRVLQGASLLSPQGPSFPRSRRTPPPTLEEGLEILMQALRVVEHTPNNGGAVSVINVCRTIVPLERDRIRNRVRNRAVARFRLLELASASLAEDGRRGLFIEDEERLEGLPPLAPGWYAGDGDTVIPATPYRKAGDDEVLQLAGMVSYSLLQQEDPAAMSEALNFHLAFTILDSVLDRRAGPRDPQGVARL